MKAALGEIVDAEELGGALLHTQVSGVGRPSRAIRTGGLREAAIMFVAPRISGR